MEVMQKETKKRNKENAKQEQNNHDEVVKMLKEINDKLGSHRDAQESDISKEKGRVSAFVEELEKIIKFAKDNKKEEVTVSFNLLSLIILKDDLQGIIDSGLIFDEDTKQKDDGIFGNEKNAMSLSQKELDFFLKK